MDSLVLSVVSVHDVCLVAAGRRREMQVSRGGEVLVTEVEFTGNQFVRFLPESLRQYVVEVHFDPAALPAWCAEHPSGRPLAVAERVRAATLDGGEFGIRWGYDR